MRTPSIDPSLVTVLKKLKLGHVVDTLAERLVLADKQSMSMQDLMLLVLSDEVTRRESTSTVRRANAAGLDAAMQIERWDKSAKVTYDKRVFAELMSLRFIESHQHVIVLGPVGVGTSTTSNLVLPHAAHASGRRAWSSASRWPGTGLRPLGLALRLADGGSSGLEGGRGRSSNAFCAAASSFGGGLWVSVVFGRTLLFLRLAIGRSSAIRSFSFATCATSVAFCASAASRRVSTSRNCARSASISSRGSRDTRARDHDRSSLSIPLRPFLHAERRYHPPRGVVKSMPASSEANVAPSIETCRAPAVTRGS